MQGPPWVGPAGKGHGLRPSGVYSSSLGSYVSPFLSVTTNYSCVTGERVALTNPSVYRRSSPVRESLRPPTGGRVVRPVSLVPDLRFVSRLSTLGKILVAPHQIMSEVGGSYWDTAPDTVRPLPDGPDSGVAWRTDGGSSIHSPRMTPLQMRYVPHCLGRVPRWSNHPPTHGSCPYRCSSERRALTPDTFRHHESSRTPLPSPPSCWVTSTSVGCALVVFRCQRPVPPSRSVPRLPTEVGRGLRVGLPRYRCGRGSLERVKGWTGRGPQDGTLTLYSPGTGTLPTLLKDHWFVPSFEDLVSYVGLGRIPGRWSWRPVCPPLRSRPAPPSLPRLQTGRFRVAFTLGVTRVTECRH